MGLIKNIFGAIFGVVGGVFKAIFGIFGLGKQSEYYLEADDASGGKQSQEQPAAPEEVKPAPAAQESTPAPVAATKAEAPTAADTPKSALAPQPVAVAPQPEPVGNFATDYLMAPSATMGRRRPGPSLSPFKDLAKGMKLPSGAR
jgi:hypothetical protein